MEATPGHRGSIVQDCLNRIKDRPIPMMFENAPAAFDWIVLAVVWWVIGQPHPEAILVRECNHPLHELRTPTMVFRAVIQIDDQRGNVGKAPVYCVPPL